MYNAEMLVSSHARTVSQKRIYACAEWLAPHTATKGVNRSHRGHRFVRPEPACGPRRARFTDRPASFFGPSSNLNSTSLQWSPRLQSYGFGSPSFIGG